MADPAGNHHRYSLIGRAAAHQRPPDIFDGRGWERLVRKGDVDATALEALLRKAFGSSCPVSWARTPDGVSTQVYRVVRHGARGAETFYLRVAEEPGQNLETDAELHRRLLRLGVKVADIVFVEPFDSTLDRSVMITTSVPGTPLSSDASTHGRADVEEIVREAGADLARINQVSVRGFGWVCRGGSDWPLRAELDSYPDFVASDFPSSWPGPLASLFDDTALAAIEGLVDGERGRQLAQGYLVHGDFDLTQIFSAADRYAGLIDFGEIRGADPLFDLGHFHLHDGELHEGEPLLPALLDGYQRVQPLPPGYAESIRSSAVLLGLRQLCRWLAPERGLGLDHPVIVARAKRITQILDPRLFRGYGAFKRD
jgi:Ser/Thr protein kinase RdoA (MazF antagonist)